MILKIKKHLKQKSFFKTIKNKIQRILEKKALIYRYKDNQKLVNISLLREINSKLNNDQETAWSKIEYVLEKQFRGQIHEKNTDTLTELISILSKLFVNRKLGFSKDQDQYKVLLEKIDMLDYSMLSTSMWITLEYISGCSGLYIAANKFRNLAIKKSITVNDKFNKISKSELFEGFTAAIDSGDYIVAKSFIEKTKQIAYKSLPINEMKQLYNIMINDKKSAYKLAKPRYKNNDKIFAMYLEGKSVAIVGPAPSDKDLGDEIDSYDIVIRLNYKGKDFLPPRDEFGSTIHVSYYNGQNSTYIKDIDEKDFLKDLDYAVFKSAKYPYQKNMIFKSKSARKVKSNDLFLFTGYLTMIPVVILDILAFNPSQVKVFKSNFFLSNKAYREGYQLKGNIARSNDQIWYTHWEHDIISQVNIVRNLWQVGRIKVDDECQRVLELTSEDYIRRMELLYVER